MKICIWTTSLQADTLALAIALDRDPEVELLIVAASLVAYQHEPIARFLAQCYNQMDLDYRIRRLKIAEQNCRIWGSAYSDLLLNPPYRRYQRMGA